MSHLLREADGTTHVALVPNDRDAAWTPIACGEGIAFPGGQFEGVPSCPKCVEREKVRNPNQVSP